MTDDDQNPKVIQAPEQSVTSPAVSSPVRGQVATTAPSQPKPAGQVPEAPTPPALAGGTPATPVQPAQQVVTEAAAVREKKKPATKKGSKPNMVRRIRIERMMSKAELARSANLSVLTIDRVEKGFGCRVDTKRKILEALGLSLADRVRVFGEEE